MNIVLQLREQVDVLVNNGGYGAIMTALDSGIPVIVAGSGQDKIVTNNLVEYTGVGINLRSKTPSVDAIREGVSKVLDDGKYKLNAVMMSRKFEEYDVGTVFDNVIQSEVKRWKDKSFREEGMSREEV
jgi:UDP:flavonoid glycosyltransferase YjiC (YdhE family)